MIDGSLSFVAGDDAGQRMELQMSREEEQERVYERNELCWRMVFVLMILVVLPFIRVRLEAAMQYSVCISLISHNPAMHQRNGYSSKRIRKKPQETNSSRLFTPSRVSTPIQLPSFSKTNHGTI